MNRIFFIIALVFFLFAAYSYFIIKNKKHGSIAVILAVKTIFLWAILLGGPKEILPSLLPLAGIMFVLAAAGIIMNRDAEHEPDRTRYILTVVMIFLLMIFGAGCSGNGPKKPEITGELKLNYVPSAMAAPEKEELYVSSERGNMITVYDMRLLSKKRTIAAGYMPVDILFSGGAMYTANKSSNTVTIYNMAAGTSRNVNSGGAYPSSVAVDMQKNRLYVANLGTNNVAVLDLTQANTPVVKSIPVGKWPSDLYLSPDSRYLYVCCKYTNTIQVIDAEKEQPVFTKVDTGISPSKMVALSKKQIAIINEWEYAYNHQSTILVFDRINYSLEYDIMVEGGIFDAVLSKNKRYLYVSVPMKDILLFVDLEKRRTVFELNMTGATPRWLALSKDGKNLYVSGQQTQKVYTISLNGMI
jgi:DNA-binding beta-propeller fold protein YncE